MVIPTTFAREETLIWYHHIFLFYISHFPDNNCVMLKHVGCTYSPFIPAFKCCYIHDVNSVSNAPGKEKVFVDKKLFSCQWWLFPLCKANVYNYTGYCTAARIYELYFWVVNIKGQINFSEAHAGSADTLKVQQGN